MNIPCWTKFA